MAELLRDDGSPEEASEWWEEVQGLSEEVRKLELAALFSGKDDARDAILTIHPGAGGRESQDWADMLFRMYLRWAERERFEVTVLDLQRSDEGGVKSVSAEVRGVFAYGRLRSERGVHRLVRISPFDARARRHTSFASAFVYPLIEDDIEVEVDESDLRIDTYRASGAGGQHVNKTDSAVRITHLPTGIVASCQNERSQHKNRSTAMKMLRAALYERLARKAEEEKLAMEASKTENAWGNQIRSYVFAPYTLAVDHRTKVKKGDARAVLDGDLEDFMQAYLKKFRVRSAG